MLSAERSAVSRARALAREAQQIGAGRGAAAVLGQPLDLDLGIERAEEGLGDRQAGDDDRARGCPSRRRSAPRPGSPPPR